MTHVFLDCTNDVHRKKECCLKSRLGMREDLEFILGHDELGEFFILIEILSRKLNS